MNFHCYGNMWIHPFNYMHKAHKYPDIAYKEIINFYEEFKGEVAQVSKAQYGNAIEMVGYATDGEASDWMLGEHKIVAFSPELGSFNEAAQTFFLPKDLIFDVIEENYKVVELFMKRNNFELKNLIYGINNKNELTVSFINNGLANIFKPRFVLTSENSELLRSINQVTARYEDGNYTEININQNDTNIINGLSFDVDKINRLSEFHLRFEVNDPELLKSKISINVEILMADDTSLGGFNINYDNGKFGGLITIYLLMLVALFLLILIIFSLRIMRKHSKKNEAVETINKPITNPNETV